MEILSFLKQYVRRPRTVGAILPSSKYLASKMIENINFNTAKYIVEYGPGTGIFTEKIMTNRDINTTILLFETNENFYNMLKSKYKDQVNIYIINDSAEYMEKYMKKYDIPWIDYIVSGLPFASLPANVSSNILNQTQKHLNYNGKFITFQYTLLKKTFIEKYFKNMKIRREFRNIPPAYVFCCRP